MPSLVPNEVAQEHGSSGAAAEDFAGRKGAGAAVLLRRAIQPASHRLCRNRARFDSADFFMAAAAKGGTTKSEDKNASDASLIVCHAPVSSKSDNRDSVGTAVGVGVGTTVDAGLGAGDNDSSEGDNSDSDKGGESVEEREQGDARTVSQRLLRQQVAVAPMPLGVVQSPTPADDTD